MLGTSTLLEATTVRILAWRVCALRSVFSAAPGISVHSVGALITRNRVPFIGFLE